MPCLDPDHLVQSRITVMQSCFEYHDENLPVYPDGTENKNVYTKFSFGKLRARHYKCTVCYICTQLANQDFSFMIVYDDTEERFRIHPPVIES